MAKSKHNQKTIFMRKIIWIVILFDPEVQSTNDASANNLHISVKYGFKIHELKYEVQRFMNWSVIFLICQIQMLWSVYGLLKSIITCSYSDEFSMSSLLWFVKTAFLIEIEIKVVVSTVVLKMIIHYRNCKYLNSFKATYFIKLYS